MGCGGYPTGWNRPTRTSSDRVVRGQEQLDGRAGLWPTWHFPSCLEASRKAEKAGREACGRGTQAQASRKSRVTAKHKGGLQTSSSDDAHADSGVTSDLPSKIPAKRSAAPCCLFSSRSETGKILAALRMRFRRSCREDRLSRQLLRPFYTGTVYLHPSLLWGKIRRRGAIETAGPPLKTDAPLELGPERAGSLRTLHMPANCSSGPFRRMRVQTSGHFQQFFFPPLGMKSGNSQSANVQFCASCRC
ncbi:uncharacterized protein LOC133509221 [Syngnathoides biaculeatus]|uniref:uncharacterized protein LOC133509221 n=1 Tax=Syngnathoides biaculeatus TaxID=300417 RepID=UPI002ADD985C|nr:uncharacterized protein LOC133509221 [Syngnathoides biaculeatus]